MLKRSMLSFGVMVLLAAPIAAQQDMTFFITSRGSGDGANLGGLAGADRHCQALGYAVGFGDYTWRAYLSAAATADATAVNARDRIGTGPWHNSKGVQVASGVADLHGDNAVLTKETILNENGDVTNGRGDDPNRHDILTGTNLDGTLFTGEDYDNCGNWTGNGDGSTRVGHHDRQGGGQNPTSWNSAHNSRGCSQDNLEATGGSGLYYCFAVDAGNDPALKENWN